MKRILLLVIIISVCVSSQAQDFSNKGKDFWVAYSGHIDGTTSRMALYITSDVNANGTVDVNGTSKSFTVTANQVTTVQLTTATSPSNTMAYNGQVEGTGGKKGIHIVTDKPVVVYSHILNSARSGSTLVLPTNVLGKEYYVASYKSIGAGVGKRSEFDIVATEDSTTVEITPTNADATPIHPANVTYQIALTKGDVYQYQSNEDLTGTHIKSIGTGVSGCKRIAVYSGSTWTAMGCTNASSGDNLYQEMFPYSSWGKNYYTAPFIGRAFDIFRILVQDPNEPVYVNGVALSTGSLVSGRFYEFNTQGNNTARVITSNKPICVLQYMITMACDGSIISDPEMVILNAAEQTLNDITVMSARKDLTPPATNITSHYLNIIFKTIDYGSLKVDGATPLAIPSPIGGTAYSFIQENVTASTNSNPAHRVTSDSGFICIAYGYGNVESYGYNAGTNVKDLLNFITPINPLNITGEPSACATTPFYFSVTYPFQPLSLVWDFHGFQNPNVTVSTPVADTTYLVSGKQVWRYRLPTPYIYNLSGHYPLTITAGTSGSDGCGDTQVREDTIYVFDPPVTRFGYTHNGCVNDSVSFRDSTNYVAGTYSYKWYWDFGDGTYDSVRHPKHLYAAPGTYKVRFALISNVGCLSDTSARDVVVTNIPIAKFGISSPYCEGATITFSDSSSSFAPSVLAKWYWDYGDGSKDSVSNNSNRLHSYTPWGNKTATLKVETSTGCQSNPFSKTFYISPNPVANFNLPGGICLPADSAHFVDVSSIADGTQNSFKYLWNFGDPPSAPNDSSSLKNPVHYYNNAGPFSIKLVVTSATGCKDSTTKVLNTVYPHPISAFTVLPENCINDVTTFTSNSSGSGSTISEWHWNFGDGQTSSIQNPVHTYATAGTYTVKHWVITDKGCSSDTLTKTVTINSLPSANFNFTLPSCETKVISFNDISTPNSGTLNTWAWNFGDPASGALNSSGSQNPTHTFLTAGTYTVTLTVKSDKGCQSTVASKQVTINAQPLPGFVLPEVCLSDAFAQFNDTSKIAAGTITGWAWNFGDPASGALNTSALKNPQHRYNAIGNYTVTLTVTSNNNCTATLSQAFTVNGDIPVSNFTPLNPANLCANDSVAIQNTSTVNFGNITKVEIYWDNAGSPTIFQTDDFPVPGKIYKHLYPNFQAPLAKTFTIRYRAYSGASCVNDRIRTVTVNAAPKVQFAAIPNACFYAAPYQITQATETGGVPGTYQFTGPGITTSGIFTPATAGVGTHTLHYTFTSSTGCVDTVSQKITVLPPPIANFLFSSPACETKAITFSDSSASSAGVLTKWTWDYNDGSPVDVRNSGAAFTHVFSSANSYNVKLTVTTNNQCSSLPVIKIVKINPEPVVNFSKPVVCLPNANATFFDQSIIADGTQNLFSYLWDFGDPSSGLLNSSTQKNPSHIYSAIGPYNVRLSVTTNNGCKKDTVIAYNNIHPQPTANFTADPMEICTNSSITFTDLSTGTDTTLKAWLWNFGDGISSSQPTPPPHIYSSAGTFNVQLTVTNANNCVSTPFSLPITVDPIPLVDAGPDRNVLEGGTIVLSPVITGINLQYLWTPPDYLSSATVKTPTVTGVNDRMYKITVTGPGGCSASDSLFVKVLRFPKIPNTFTPNNDGINDTWIIQYLETYPGNRVQVFNRYGQMVFESLGYGTPWDGTMNGKPLPFGTYYYIIEPGNGRKPLTGYVTLLK